MNRILSALLIAVAAPSALAQVTVKEPWVRATVAQQTATGVFMQLNAKQDARLIEARSGAAQIVELHEMAMAGDVMKMRQVPYIDLPAGKVVELKPGGYHVMLINLKQQVKEGDVVPVTLVIEGKDKAKETIELKVPARPLGSTATGSPHKH